MLGDNGLFQKQVPQFRLSHDIGDLEGRPVGSIAGLGRQGAYDLGSVHVSLIDDGLGADASGQLDVCDVIQSLRHVVMQERLHGGSPGNAHEHAVPDDLLEIARGFSGNEVFGVLDR